MLMRKRCCRGMSLFGALLAMAVFGVFAAAGMEWLQDRARERVVKMAGAQAVALSDAAGSWVEGSFEARLAAAPETVSLATIRAAGVLAPGFAPNGSDAMGRRLRIVTRSPLAGVLHVLVTQDVAAGDEWFPSGAVLGVRGAARIGVVPPGVTPAQLRGPALRADVADFRTDHGGLPEERAIGVLTRHDRQSVYGDYLYRGAVAGLTAANTMETDLEMDRHDITGVGDVEAQSMTLEGDLEVGGALRVTADLLIGGSGRVEGIATVAGGVHTDSARVAGALTADTGTFTGQVRAQTVVAAGQVSGASLDTAGSLTAGSATVSGPVFAGSIGTARATSAGAVVAGSARVGQLSADDVDVSGTADVVGAMSAGSVRARGRLDADSAGFTSLVVGNCIGC